MCRQKLEKTNSLTYKRFSTGDISYNFQLKHNNFRSLLVKLVLRFKELEL